MTGSDQSQRQPITGNNMSSIDFKEEISACTRDSRIVCPACGHDRKKKGQKTMSITVNTDGNLYCCHHCGIKGMVKRERFYEKYTKGEAVSNITKIPTQLNYNVDLIKSFFSKRGITLDTLEGLPPMTTGRKYFHGVGEKDAVGFIYGNRESPDAIKWRAIDSKAFTQDGAAREFYGLSMLEESEDIIVVEGECDVIALASIGIQAVSCPNGAPAKVSHRRVDPEEDAKFAYIWEAREILDKKKRVILAVDNDEAGEALAEEIARRVGRAKCWRVKFPDKLKDANDAVASLTADKVRESVASPVPMPLQGVYGATEYHSAVTEIYDNGCGTGASTGMPCVDDLFTISEGQLSIVTGIPSSGKSEFVDQIMINLARESKWKFAVCSFENPPQLHIAKLAEKVVGKPFYEGWEDRMSKAEMDDAIKFIDDHFVFLESRDGAMSTIESIIERAKQAVMRLGVRGLLIDPYNYIERVGENENEGISEMLTKISLFAKSHGIHVWFVAHPTKVRMNDDGTYPVPKGNEVSGSAAWFAKADIGVTIHRGDAGTEVHCWKCRWKWVGKQGQTYLSYDLSTGRFFDGAYGLKSTTKKLAKQAPQWKSDPDNLEF